MQQEFGEFPIVHNPHHPGLRRAAKNCLNAVPAVLPGYIANAIRIAYSKAVPVSNFRVDQLTRLIIARRLRKDSVCIDVGAFRGEVLELFTKFAPLGRHFAFEPSPPEVKKLREAFAKKKNVTVYDYALSNYCSEDQVFERIDENPALSSLYCRNISNLNLPRTEFHVKTVTLDSLFDSKTRVDVIKIDAEGAEYPIMQGAAQLLKAQKPLLIFEHEKNGALYSGSGPKDVFSLLTETCGMKISTLPEFYDSGDATLSLQMFCEHFENQTATYFVAHA